MYFRTNINHIWEFNSNARTKIPYGNWFCCCGDDCWLCRGITLKTFLSPNLKRLFSSDIPVGIGRMYAFSKRTCPRKGIYCRDINDIVQNRFDIDVKTFAINGLWKGCDRVVCRWIDLFKYTCVNMRRVRYSDYKLNKDKYRTVMCVCKYNVTVIIDKTGLSKLYEYILGALLSLGILNITGGINERN